MELQNWFASHSPSSSSSSSPSVERSLSFVFQGNRRHRLESHRGHAEACVPAAQFTVCSKVCPDCSMRLAQVSGFEFGGGRSPMCEHTSHVCLRVDSYRSRCFSRLRCTHANQSRYAYRRRPQVHRCAHQLCSGQGCLRPSMPGQTNGRQSRVHLACLPVLRKCSPELHRRRSDALLAQCPASPFAHGQCTGRQLHQICRWSVEVITGHRRWARTSLAPPESGIACSSADDSKSHT
jgi:hypothetical protein